MIGEYRQGHARSVCGGTTTTSSADNLLKSIGRAKYHQKKQTSKLEEPVMQWIHTMIGTPKGSIPAQPAAEQLRDGVLLCKLINMLKLGSVRKFNTSPTDDTAARENVTLFLKAALALNVDEWDLFTPDDLLKGTGIAAVLSSLDLLHRLHKGGVLFLERRRQKKGIASRNRSRSVADMRPDLSENVSQPLLRQLGEIKSDPRIEIELRRWIEGLLCTKLDAEISFQMILRNGELLCRVINEIQPGTIKEINMKTDLAYKHMENIEQFLQACRTMGVSNEELFATPDLYAGKNMGMVMCTLIALRDCARRFFGIEVSTSKKRGHQRRLSGVPISTPLSVRVGNSPLRNRVYSNPSLLNSPTSPGSPSSHTRKAKPLASPLRNRSPATKKATARQASQTLNIHDAAKDGMLDVVQMLLNEEEKEMVGTPPTKTSSRPALVNSLSRDGEAPLHLAVENGHLDLVRLLLTHPSIDVNVPDADLRTPLFLAVMSGQADVVQVLLAAGADPNLQSKDMNTPLHCLVTQESSDHVESLLKLFLESGADVNLHNRYGETPLGIAVVALNCTAVEMITGSGHADVNACNNFGETPLHKAIRMLDIAPADALHLVTLLLKSGASPNIKGVHGTVLDLVSESMRDQVRDLLASFSSPDEGDAGGAGGPAACPSMADTDEIVQHILSKIAHKRYTEEPGSARTERDILRELVKDLESQRGSSGSLFGLEDSTALLEAQEEVTPPPPSKPAPVRETGMIVMKKGYRVEEPVPEVKKPAGPEQLQHTARVYKELFASNKHLNWAGFLQISLASQSREPCIVSALEEPFRGEYTILIRTKRGSELVFIPAAKIPGKLNWKSIENVLSESKTVLKNAEMNKCEGRELVSELLDFEENDPQRTTCFPVGVVLKKEGQSSQWEMWDNEHSTEDFKRFLSIIGDKIKLLGWSGYTGGLDVKANSRGEYSYYTQWEGFQIMYHVSTLLPFDPQDKEKLQRSRMINNDICMIIYSEGPPAYQADTMTGSVSHCYVVVSPVRAGGKVTGFRVSSCCKDYVSSYGPPIPDYVFQIDKDDELLRNFLLTKVINGHLAAQRSPGLSQMYIRPRLYLLEELVKQFSKKKKGLLDRLRK